LVYRGLGRQKKCQRHFLRLKRVGSQALKVRGKSPTHKTRNWRFLWLGAPSLSQKIVILKGVKVLCFDNVLQVLILLELRHGFDT